MNSYTITTTLARPYDAAVEPVRDGPGRPGVRHPHRDRPQGHAEDQARRRRRTAGDPRRLPARTGLRGTDRRTRPSPRSCPATSWSAPLDEATTIVEAFDPDAMMGLADNDALTPSPPTPSNESPPR